MSNELVCVGTSWFMLNETTLRRANVYVGYYDVVHNGRKETTESPIIDIKVPPPPNGESWFMINYDLNGATIETSESRIVASAIGAIIIQSKQGNEQS